MPRPFYIIGHNPNTIDEAVKFLKAGANALEPDVHYMKETGRFRVAHENPGEGDPHLDEYLRELAGILKSYGENQPLALITFDLKEPYDYDIRNLYTVIRECFSHEFPGVKIVTTVSTMDGVDFLTRVKGDQRDHEAIGIDQNAKPQEVVSRLQYSGLRYTYADGITFFGFEPIDSLIGPKSFEDRIRDAALLREGRYTEISEAMKDAPVPGRDPMWPQLAYVWCLNTESDIRHYLDLDPPIDAILTDEVEMLRKILREPKYRERFTFAEPLTLASSAKGSSSELAI